MKRVLIPVIATFFIVGGCLQLFAQEQRPGHELVFPKDQVKEHPSDLHMGSDPYYNRGKEKYEGGNDTGYPREYDPNAEYRQSTTTIKKVDKKKKSEDEPAE